MEKAKGEVLERESCQQVGGEGVPAPPDVLSLKRRSKPILSSTGHFRPRLARGGAGSITDALYGQITRS